MGGASGDKVGDRSTGTFSEDVTAIYSMKHR